VGQLQSAGYFVVGVMLQFAILNPNSIPVNAVNGKGGPVVDDAMLVAKFVL
jgi:hypothetical protein